MKEYRTDNYLITIEELDKSSDYKLSLIEYGDFPGNNTFTISVGKVAKQILDGFIYKNNPTNIFISITSNYNRNELYRSYLNNIKGYKLKIIDDSKEYILTRKDEL